jgi:hypothetical protein
MNILIARDFFRKGKEGEEIWRALPFSTPALGRFGNASPPFSDKLLDLSLNPTRRVTSRLVKDARNVGLGFFQLGVAPAEMFPGRIVTIEN